MAGNIAGVEQTPSSHGSAHMTATLPVPPRPGPHAFGQVFVRPPPERSEEAVILLSS
jgi:hypothetical protein